MMDTNKKRLIGIALCTVVIVPTALAMRFYHSLPNEPLTLGASVPHFEVEPVRGARADLRKGRRALFFFSPSCPHCIETIAHFDHLRTLSPELFAGDRALGWAFISIADKDKTTAFAHHTSWPIYHDADRRAMKTMRGVSVPYLVLVDENGLVRYRHSGELSAAQYKAMLTEFYHTGRVPPADIR